MEPRPVYDFAVEGPVQAEVFVLWLQDDGVRLGGPCGADPWYIELGEDDDPLDTVSRMVRLNVGEPTVSHSTSWRRSRGAVTLSFIVVVDRSIGSTIDSVAVPRVEITRGEATSAPATVESAHVIEHGLRHLSWLVKDDPVVRDALGAAWADALGAYVPEPFRQLRPA